MDKKPNFYRLHSALTQARAAGSQDATIAAIAAIDLSEWAADFDRLAHSSLAAAVKEITGGRTPPADAESLDLSAKRTDELIEVTTALLPRFHLVLIDETRDWGDLAKNHNAGRIWATYLYDENQVTYAAELTPSYDLRYLYSNAENEVPEEIRELLLTEGAPEDGGMYVHCHIINAIGWNRKQFCQAPSDPGADDYDALIESELEYYRGNWVFTSPQRPGTHMLTSLAQQHVEAGRPREARAALLAALEDPASDSAPPFAPIQVIRKIDRALEKEDFRAALELLRAFNNARPAKEKVPTPMSDPLVRAQEASRFFSELQASVEVISDIATEFNVRTLSDVLCLQGAILDGGRVDSWQGQSSIIEVIQRLPSAAHWMGYVAEYDRDGHLVKASAHGPSLPPVSPLSGDARECLMDVVSHAKNFSAALITSKEVAAIAAAKAAAEDHGGAFCEANWGLSWWDHEIAVVERMRQQAIKALGETDLVNAPAVARSADMDSPQP